MSCSPITYGYNIGCKTTAGIQRIWIAEYNGTDLQYTIDNSSPGITSSYGTIIGFGGSIPTLYEFDQNLETASYTEVGSFNNENQTAFYTGNLQITLNGLRQSIIEQIKQLGRGRWRIFILDQNGKYWLMGKQNDVMVISSTPTLGKSYGDLNGSTIVFESKEPKPITQVSSAAFNSLINPVVEPYFRMTLDSGWESEFSGDPNNVEDWNTFFDLPVNGNPFTSVEVLNDVVTLRGGSEINLNSSPGLRLIEVEDTGCVISLGDSVYESSSLTTVSFSDVTTAGDYCFYDCQSLTSIDLPSLVTAGDNCFAGHPIDSNSLTSVNLPLLETAGDFCFQRCTSLTSVNLPSLITAGIFCFDDCTSLISANLPSLITAGNSCFNTCSSLTSINLPSLVAPSGLGGSVDDDTVFNGINGATISLTIPAAFMTNNGGNPDGDIQYLQANNTVIITTV